MNTTDYWPMARVYSVWNATVAALQFWTADLEVHVLSSAIEQVYNAFFYSTSTHLLCQQSDEILFSHFMTTLNPTFESKLAFEDEGYESGSENFNIPTPLRWTSKIHHVSSVKNMSFDPDPVPPCSTGTRESHHRPVHRGLIYSSFEDDDDTPTDKIPLPDCTLPVQYHVDAFQWPSSKYTLNAYVTLEEEEEEGFPTVPLNDEHWDMEEIPDRHLCIHEHSLPHGLCPYLCPYSDYQTSSYYEVEESNDYIQWWRHPCTWGCWILKWTMVRKWTFIFLSICNITFIIGHFLNNYDHYICPCVADHITVLWHCTL